MCVSDVCVQSKRLETECVARQSVSFDDSKRSKESLFFLSLSSATSLPWQPARWHVQFAFSFHQRSWYCSNAHQGNPFMWRRREENVLFHCLHSPCIPLVRSHVHLQPVSHLGEGKERGEGVESLFIIVVLCATWPRRHRRRQRKRKLGNRLRWGSLSTYRRRLFLSSLARVFSL